MDRTSMHTAGQNHDQMSRVSMMYSGGGHYSTGGGDRGGSTANNDHDGGMMDLRSRYLQLQKKFQLTAQEHAEMKSKLGKVTEERDKTQKKLDQTNYIYGQHQQLQGYVQRLKFEKEQLEQQLRHLRVERGDKTEIDTKYKHLVEDSKRLRNDLDCAIQDRDGFKYQLSELQRENEKLNSRLKSISPNVNSSRRELDCLLKEKEELTVIVDRLRKENETVKHEKKKISSDAAEVSEVVTKLKEENTSILKQLQESRKTIADLEHEILQYKDKRRDFSPSSTKSDSGESLNRQSSEESISGLRSHQRSMGRIGEDFPPLGRAHSNSITELETMTHGLGFQKKKLSASTNNLSEDPHGRKDQIVSKLQTQLNRVFKEKEKLSQKLSSMRNTQSDMESKIRLLEEERDLLRTELGQTKQDTGTAKNEMEVMKGVAFQQTTQTYEKNMKLQTQLLEMQTEKSLIEKQRDIAMKERERMVTEAISLKKKLETIKSQRQKDAKELASMRKQKDKTEKESEEMSKKYNTMRESQQTKENQYYQLVESLKPLFSSPSDISSDDKDIGVQVKKLVTQLHQEHSDYQTIVRLVYGADSPTVSTSTLAAKLESLFSEKSEMVVEIEELQRSASKLNEDRIFDLKQTIETLYMEQEGLNGKNHSLMSRIGKLEVERDKLRQECERLDKQCQELNSTISSPARIGNLLKNSSQRHWEETWETKHIQVPLRSEGKAGFSVVGGRDQPQLPNPGAFIVTTVNKGGPAEGKLRVGDVLETVNGIDLQNAEHSTAVHAVKESKGLLDIVLKRRKKAHALQVGVAGAILTLGEEKKTKKETNEYSLLLQKEGVGFTYDWEAHYTVTGITEGGPANLILQEGDRVVQINGQSVSKEKPSAVKKLLKPHKGILRLVVEREVEQNNFQYLTSQAPPPSVQESLVTSNEHGSGSGSTTKLKLQGGGGGSSWESEETSQTSFDHTGNHTMHRQASYMSSQDSGASQEPVKMVDKERMKHKDRYRKFSSEPQSRPNSDGFMYGGGYKKDGYEDSSYSSEIGCTGYTESICESFLSEPSSYHDIDSSQTSIELTFHPFSQVSHNHLTVQSTLSTLPDKESNSEDDSYFARDDGTRTTFRTRSGSDGNMPSYGDFDTPHKSKKPSGRKNKLNSVRKGFRSGSMSQLSEPEYEQYIDPSSKKRSRSKSLLAVRGKSRSNLSLTPARSMTSVIEEPRRSVSITSVTSEHDPLADATYIRANFSYIPRHPQEIPIKYGDIFHIIEEAPSARHRRSFWVSKLNEDGTDSDIGAIPNCSRAQEWLDEQGEASDIFVYEEVEPFNGVRPVIICGVLANKITESLTESYPRLFYQCKTEFLEGTARIIEVRLTRERSEGKIIDFQRVNDGYNVIPKFSLSPRENKGKCVLISGSLNAVQSLKKFAPPISILIKAGAEESLRAFGYDHLRPEEVQQMYGEARMMDEQHHHEFTACLTLVYEETLLEQITDIVKNKKHNQTWVPVKRLHTS